MADVLTGSSRTQPEDADEWDQPRFGSLASIIYLLLLTWAAGIATFPLNDNSFFTHLATGRLILARGSVPSSDPYTFTAQGEPWVVQSWLASVTYAGAERLAGDVGLRLIVLVVFLSAMTVLWKLTSPIESVIPRFLLLAGALFVVTDLWGERPYMIGVIGLGLVWLALEGRFRAWLLLPFMWVWVNTHGSWPLASALAVALIAGAVLDRRLLGLDWRPEEAERHAAAAVLAGSVLGAVGPLGLRALAFPFSAFTRSDVFAEIIEWRPPVYTSVAERSYLVLVVLIVVLLVRKGSWTLTLPGVLFAAAGIYSQRNIVMATVVLVAVGARAAPALGTLKGWHRPRLGPVFGVALLLLTVVTALLAVTTPAISANGFGGYPARALAVLPPGSFAKVSVAAEASTGNLIEVLGPNRGTVFVDDRVDMLPTDIFQDFLVLDRGQLGWQGVLDRHDIDVVVWDRAAPIGSLLAADEDWRLAYSDSQSFVACRRRVPCPVLLPSS